MKIKSIHQLSALICGLILLPLTVFAETKVVDNGQILVETGSTYEGTATEVPLMVSDPQTLYSGTNIVFINTFSGSAGSVLGKGIYVKDNATLSLSGGNISTEGLYGTGIYLTGTSNATVNNVNITIAANAYGVNTLNSSTLTLTGGTIRTGGNNGQGLDFSGSSSGTVDKVDIGTQGIYSHGIEAFASSSLTLTDSVIRTSGREAHGLHLMDTGSATVSNSDIRASGSGAYGIHVIDNSACTVELDGNPLSGGEGGGSIYASTVSTVILTGRNGSSITGNVTGTDNSTVNLTLSGEDTKFVGNVTQDVTSTVTLDISDGATLGDAATANTINGIVNIHEGGHIITTLTLTNGITLETGSILDYALNETGLLVADGIITISGGILVDFSSLIETGTYTVFDWSGATTSGITANLFNIAGTEVEGTFEVNGTQLTFTATAVPEPSVYLLLGVGLGILLITARRRRNVQS
jgi:hypothetical protein